MVDCNVIENYLKEKARMCESYENCDDCPFDKFHGFHICGAPEAESFRIVQKWSNEHPRKTLFDDLKEKFPNCDFDGMVPAICPFRLGYEKHMWCKGTNSDCKGCWNRPLNEVVQ